MKNTINPVRKLKEHIRPRVRRIYDNPVTSHVRYLSRWIFIVSQGLLSNGVFSNGIKSKKRIIFLFSLLLFSNFMVNVFADATPIHTSVAPGGNWSTAGTWDNGIPAVGDNVVIASGHTVTLTANSSITDVTIDNGGILNNATRTLTISGNYTNNGTHSGTGGITLTGSSKTIDGTGSITNTGTFTISTGAKTIAATANLTFSGTVSISGAITVTNNGIVTINGNLTGSAAGSTWVNAANAALNVNGTLLTTGTLTATASGNTVDYKSSGAQTIKAATYHHLTLSGSGTKTAGGNITINGNLTIGSGVTFAGGGSSHSIGGNWTNNGGSFTSTGTVTFNSTASAQEINGSSASMSFNNLTVNKSGQTLTIAGSIATLTLSGTLTLTAGTFSAGTVTTISVSGNWTNNAGASAFTANTSTVNLVPSANRTLTGSTTFSNLTFNGPGRTFTIAAGTTLTTTGTLSLTDGTVNTGTIAAKGNISLASTFDGGTAPLNINGDGAQTLTGGGSATAGDFIPVTINKGSGTLTLSGIIRTGRNWTYTAGTIDAGSSTVVFSLASLTISGSMSFYSLTFNSAVTYTIAAGTTLTTTGTLTLTDGTINTGSIAAKGNISLASTFDGGTAPLTISGTVNQTLTGGGSATAGTFLPLTINKTGGTLSLASIIRTGRNWTYTAGTVDAGSSTVVFSLASLTISGSMSFYSLTFNSAVTYTIAAGTTLTTTGTLSLTDGTVNTGTIAAKGNISLASTFDGGTAPLNINGDGAQTLTGGGSATAGTFLPVTINKGSGTLTLSGIIRTGRNWTYTAGTVDAGSSTVVFSLASLTINAPMSFYNLTFNSAVTYTITAGTTLTVNGILSFTDGTINTGNIYAKGDVNVASTADNGSAVITLNGTSDQRITGAASASGGHVNNILNINNLLGVVTITGYIRLHNINLQSGTLTFLGGATYTIDDADAITTSSGTTINFSGSLGSLVVLRSDAAAQWDLTVNSSGSYSAEYVDVQYCNAGGGRQIVAYNSINSGNNTKWSFPARLAFTTSSQSIIQNTASPVITVQLEDGSGTPVVVPSNSRINLTTTSSTGSFSSSSSFISTVTYVTILAGSSQASFYYKDSTAGSYTITASEYPSQNWTDATQTIIVESKGTWKYKRPITITSSANLTDYQISLTVDTQTLISASKMNSDGSDIRFYDSDDITSLSYWIESGINTASTKIWVKAPSITTSGKTIYLYYGNSSAPAVSSITNTFIFGDDFSDSSINTSQWNTSLAGSPFSIVSGSLHGTNTGTASTGRLQSQSYFTAPFILEGYVKVTTFAANGIQTLGNYATTADGLGILAYPGGTPTRYYYRNDAVWVGPYNTVALFTGWHLERITASSSTSVQIYLYRSDTGTTDTRTATNTINNERITLGKRYDNGNNSQTYVCDWDWIRVRKYASSEPSNSVGAETKCITQLNFTTAVQTLVQNKSSSLMTVQTQGFDGTAVFVSANTDIVLESSSSTGQFAPEDNSSNWSADNTLTVTITAEESSSSVSFYYKDSEVGTFTITASEYPSVGWTDTTQQETVNSAVNTFSVTAGSPKIAGSAFTLTITAKNEEGVISTEYSDAVNIIVNYVSPSNGTGTLAVTTTSSFINGIAAITNESFSDCGTITITVTKADDTTKTGTSNNITFIPYSFTVTAGESTQVVNKEFSLTVTAKNAQGQACPNYKGTANLAVNYQNPLTSQAGIITPGSLGSSNFTGGIALITNAKYNKWGSIKIKAEESLDVTRYGESDKIMFIPKDFLVTLAPPPASRDFYYKNEEFSGDIKCRDEGSNTIGNYQGIILISSSDGSLSSTYTYSAGDSGIYNFLLNFSSAGKITLNVQDKNYPALTGKSSEFKIKEGKIKVTAASGAVGSIAVRVEVVDSGDEVISDDDSTAFTVTLSESTDNNSASCNAASETVTVKGGAATIYVSDTEAETVTVTPASQPLLTPVAGTVNFGSFK